MTTLPLTEKQERLWRFIASCDRSPTYPEIREALGFAGYAGIQRALLRLQALGFIRRERYRKRGIELLIVPEGERPKPVQTLSYWSTDQLVAELERRRHKSRSATGRCNWMADARLGSASLLRALESCGVRP